MRCAEYLQTAWIVIGVCCLGFVAKFIVFDSKLGGVEISPLIVDTGMLTEGAD